MLNKPSFKEQLLDSEPVNPVIKQQYQKEIEAMLEQKLTPLTRAGQIFCLILGVSFVIFFGYTGITSHDKFNWLGQSGHILGVGIGMGCIVLSIYNLSKGRINQKSYPSIVTGMIWIGIVVMVTVCMLLIPQFKDPINAVQMVLHNLVFWVIGFVFILQNKIKQSELKTHEKLLRIEYQLAEMSEKLGKSE